MEITRDTNSTTSYGVWFYGYMGFEVWSPSEYVLFAILCAAAVVGVTLFVFVLRWGSKYIELHYAPFYVALRPEYEKTLKKKE